MANVIPGPEGALTLEQLISLTQEGNRLDLRGIPWTRSLPLQQETLSAIRTLRDRRAITLEGVCTAYDNILPDPNPFMDSWGTGPGAADAPLA